jgi:hypothetical protein
MFWEEPLNRLRSPQHKLLYAGSESLRIKVALQNKLNQDPDAVHAGLIEAMQTKMVY